MIVFPSQAAGRLSRGFRAGVPAPPYKREGTSSSLAWYTQEQLRSIRAYLARPTPEFWQSRTGFLDGLDEVIVLLDG